MNVKLNLSSTFIQVIVSAICIFFVYKILYLRAGPDTIGLWSVCMAVANFVRLADLGINSAIIKISAEKFPYTHDGIDARECFIAMLLVSMSSIFFAIILQCIFSLYEFNIEWISYYENKILLGIALFSIVISNISSTALSYLDGLQKAYIRSVINMLSSLILLCSIYFLVKDNNSSFEIAFSFLIQSISLLIFSILVIIKFNTAKINIHLNELINFWMKIKKYSLSIQMTAFLSYFGDSISRFFLIESSTLTLVGYFDICMKMVMQFRLLIVNISQTTFPYIASLNKDTRSINFAYKKLYLSTYVLTLIYFSFLILLLPLISEFWLGSINVEFMLISLILMFSMGFNTLTAPVYYVNQGTGQVNNNLVTQVILAVTNLFFGLLGTFIENGYFVIFSYALAVTFASFYQLYFTINSQLVNTLIIPPITRSVTCLTCLLYTSDAADE
jgi:O-antigen/teichoic acid export membrane protein